MKPVLNAFVIVLFFSVAALAQEKATQSFIIRGKIEREVKIGSKQLEMYPLHAIGSVDLTNHKGELKGTAKNMKGILLADILKDIILDEHNPKLFSEYYFVCVGSDNYKAVYSWNELFNTAVAQKVFIVIEKDGHKMLGHEDGILMISASDGKTGRRFVKNLESIDVRRAE